MKSKEFHQWYKNIYITVCFAAIAWIIYEVNIFFSPSYMCRDDDSQFSVIVLLGVLCAFLFIVTISIIFLIRLCIRLLRSKKELYYLKSFFSAFNFSFNLLVLLLIFCGTFYFTEEGYVFLEENSSYLVKSSFDCFKWIQEDISEAEFSLSSYTVGALFLSVIIFLSFFLASVIFNLEVSNLFYGITVLLTCVLYFVFLSEFFYQAISLFIINFLLIFSRKIIK